MSTNDPGEIKNEKKADKTRQCFLKCWSLTEQLNVGQQGDKRGFGRYTALVGLCSQG